ncbi:MAG: histone deacetylase [Hyphomicrobiaceae bacterium]|nr:histone deacetylase [Hyphomicrobiaceae bacterium]
MRFYYPDTPDLPLPDGHRFPAEKYRLVRTFVQQERVLGRADLIPSPLAERKELLLAHDEIYLDDVLAGTIPPEIQRRIGLPWSPILADRSRRTVGGAIAAARAALADGVSGQLAGGTHHAHRGFGSGFCVFNDLAVAALTMLAEGAVRRVAIVDTDVHQGDGNAAILGPDPAVFVVSLHGEKNFPFRKVPSDLDIGLPDGTGDAAYLDALAGALDAVSRFRPDLVLYLSGADPLQQDALGRLALTHEGLMARDRAVLSMCRDRAIPVTVALGGGYCRPIGPTVMAYINTLRVTRDVFEL